MISDHDTCFSPCEPWDRTSKKRELWSDSCCHFQNG